MRRKLNGLLMLGVLPLALLFTSYTRKLCTMQQSSSLNTYKLAMVQMEVDAGMLDQNLQRAEERIAKAAAHGAQIALLPEVMDLGWTDPSAKTMAYEIPDGKTCRALRKAAAQNHIYVCAGIVEKDHDKTYNAAVIIDPTGRVILKHRKLNELDIAHDLYDQGDRLNVVHTPLGTLGLYICADATAQDNTLSKSLGYMGADIILSPCAWAVPPGFDNTATPYGDTWRKVYKPVSTQFNLWVVGVSNVGKIKAGPWKDWDCIGSSLVYAPGGKEVLQAPFGPKADTVLYVDIIPKPRPARGTAWQGYWNK
jgi:predicted amidohydrolase